MTTAKVIDNHEIKSNLPTVSPLSPELKPKTGGLISYPTSSDVLNGRGGRINAHDGNVNYRRIIRAHRSEYLSDTTGKHDKKFILSNIVSLIRNSNPPGRFLEKDVTTLFWIEIGDERAKKKIAQALREGRQVYRNVRNALEKRKQNEKLRENVLKLIKLQKPHLERIQNVNNQIKLELLSENKNESSPTTHSRVSFRQKNPNPISRTKLPSPQYLCPGNQGISTQQEGSCKNVAHLPSNILKNPYFSTHVPQGQLHCQYSRRQSNNTQNLSFARNEHQIQKRSSLPNRQISESSAMLCRISKHNAELQNHFPLCQNNDPWTSSRARAKHKAEPLLRAQTTNQIVIEQHSKSCTLTRQLSKNSSTGSVVKKNNRVDYLKLLQDDASDNLYDDLGDVERCEKKERMDEHNDSDSAERNVKNEIDEMDWFCLFNAIKKSNES